MPIPKVNDYVKGTVKVLNVVELAKDTFEITFEKPADVNYVPGQFVGIKINDGKDDNGFRSYSLLSDENNNLQICVKLVEGGRGSTYLLSRKIGDKLDIMFPLGYFGFADKLTSNLVFIATGTGIVPILSLMENLPSNIKGSVKLFFGLRHEENIFYEDRIKKLCVKIKNCKFLLTLSKPKENWKGNSGRVTKYIQENSFENDTQFYLCGSGVMIKEVKNILKKKGIKNGNIIFEDFN